MRTLKQKDIIVCMEPAGKRVWMGSSLGDIRVFNKKVKSSKFFFFFAVPIPMSIVRIINACET
jgi:hypothetical protein